MEKIMRKCPKCGGTKFYAPVQIERQIVVGENDECLDILDGGVIIHKPDNNDTWGCTRCGYKGPGSDFEKKVEEKSLEDLFAEMVKGHMDEYAASLGCSPKEVENILNRLLKQEETHTEERVHIEKKPVKEGALPDAEKQHAAKQPVKAKNVSEQNPDKQKNTQFEDPFLDFLCHFLDSNEEKKDVKTNTDGWFIVI